MKNKFSSCQNLFSKTCCLLLSFCLISTPSTLKAEPDHSTPQSQAVSDPSSLKLPSLSLEDCYQLALNRSETLAIQKEEIARATAQMFQAASEALGDVDFVITRDRQQKQKSFPGRLTTGGSSAVLNDPDTLERKFVINQPLFQGFKAIGALTGAGSYKKEQKELWQRAKELLYQDVAVAFYGLLQAQKEVEINLEIQSLLKKRIEELEEREKIGRSRLSEVAYAKTRLKVIEADLAYAKGVSFITQYELEFLTGIELDGRTFNEDKLPDNISDSVKNYLEDIRTRSDVKAAELAVKTASRAILVAQSGFWPLITFQHNQYQRREGSLANVDWDMLFNIDIPLFSGGETFGLTKEAVSLWKEEKLSFSLAKRQAELEIKQSYQGWASAKETAIALKEAVNAAEENYNLQSEEYERSLVSNLDVLAALETLHQTRQNENRAYYRMKEDEAKLKVAIGEVA